MKNQPPIAIIIVALLLICISVIWFVFRNESWAWVLQNILAISLGLNALSFYRLSSYKMVTIIIVTFFLYDVFMVFISPYITKGTSIMESVAFGGRDDNVTKNELNFNGIDKEKN